MARYYRYRKYTRRFRRKTWSSRITNIDASQLVTGGNNLLYYKNLAVNPAQSDDTISQRYTVKNVFLQFPLEHTGTQYNSENSMENCQSFILYLPQGRTVSESTPYDHPEWIMASKHIGLPLDNNSPGYPPLTMRTRLARKLDTGDKIVFLLIGRNSAGTGETVQVRLTGIARFNTKAN